LDTGQRPDGGNIALMTRRQFEALVEKSLRKLPKPFKEKVANIAVVVEDWADDETLAEMGIEPPDTLYGLYQGVDITHRDSTYGNVLPDVITIYQGPIEEDAADEAEMAEIVRRPSCTSSGTTSASTTTRCTRSKTAR
jgi:predicted Zn-dependent protease with MMP-like domain